MTLWFRYLLFRLIKTFCFLFFCILTCFIIVDLSINGIRFFSLTTTTLGETALYYFRQIAKYLDLFLPLTFLLSSMKVLFDLNSHQELVALQMAGLSKKKLLSPFFFFAAILSMLSFANTQWIAPDAQDAAYAFRDARSKNKKKIAREHVYTLSLEDQSELIYQSFDPSAQELFDVFWVRSTHDIWHMKYLKINPTPPEGRYVDHLVRNQEKQFEKSESFDKQKFPDLIWNNDAILQKFVPFENRSLSQLLQQACSNCADRQSIFSHLHYKLALPLLPFLILLAISPIAMRFSRNRPTFLIAACSLFCFVALKTILDGMLILGENQVLPAYLAIWSPLILTLAFTLRPFARL